jgi:hypothetical protein
MNDLIFNCVQCDEEFEISVDDYEYYTSKNFDLPKRCPLCRRNKKKSGVTEIKRNHHEKKKHYRLKNEIEY